MKIRATTNQLGLAPMRIPKTRASWIDPVPIHTHGGRRTQARAPTADSRGMRLPAPRRMPRLGNVRLSVKLGLCFGAILALTAAIIAVDVHNVAGLEKRARARDDATWCRGSSPPSTPRRRSPTSTSPRRDGPRQRRRCAPTRWRPRGRREGRRRAARRPTDDPGSAAAHRRRRQARSTRGRSSTTSSTRPSSAATRGYAEQTRRRLRATRPPTTSIERHRRYIDRGQPRPRGGRQALRHARGQRPRRTTLDHRRAGPAGRARPRPRHRRATSARRLRALSRAAEALAEGDVDHELSVKGRDEVGRTAAALATMVEHLRSLAGAADRVAAGDLTVDLVAALRARPPRRRLRRPRGRAARRGEPDVALGHQRGRRLASSSPRRRPTPAARSRRSPAPWATSPPAPSARCAP